jgi:hypothetical protein
VNEESEEWMSVDDTKVKFKRKYGEKYDKQRMEFLSIIVWELSKVHEQCEEYKHVYEGQPPYSEIWDSFVREIYKMQGKLRKEIKDIGEDLVPQPDA